MHMSRSKAQNFSVLDALDLVESALTSESPDITQYFLCFPDGPLTTPARAGRSFDDARTAGAVFAVLLAAVAALCQKMCKPSLKSAFVMSWLYLK